MNYSLRDFLVSRFGAGGGFEMAMDSPEAFFDWRTAMISEMGRITGFAKMPRQDYLATEIESVNFQKFVRKKIVLQTGAQIFMPVYVLMPKGKGEKPPIIAIPGHGSNGKEGVCGAFKINRHYNHDYAIALARAGFAVFCPDLAGMGERREAREADNPAKSSCTDLNLAAIALGISLQAVHLHDLRALVDYIFDCDNIDKDKLAAIGFSGGGWQTLWAAAMDERIKTACICGYVHGFGESILGRHACGCNFIPGLWEGWDIADLARMIAPRRLYIETGERDPLNGPSGLANVLPQIAAIRQTYSLFDPTNLIHHIFPGGHEFSGNAIKFLTKLPKGG